MTPISIDFTRRKPKILLRIAILYTNCVCKDHDACNDVHLALSVTLIPGLQDTKAWRGVNAHALKQIVIKVPHKMFQ